MTMHKAIFPSPAAPDQWVGRGTRRPDLPRLLAVLAARQRISPTTVAMRSGTIHNGSAPADRMARFFLAAGQDRKSATGAFNLGVALYLSGTEEGEDGVYRGA